MDKKNEYFLKLTKIYFMFSGTLNCRIGFEDLEKVPSHQAKLLLLSPSVSQKVFHKFQNQYENTL